MKYVSMFAACMLVACGAMAESGQVQFPFGSPLSTNSTVTNAVTQNVRGQVTGVCVLFKGGSGTITGALTVVGAQGQTLFSKTVTGPSTNWYSVRTPVITTAGANIQLTNAVPTVVDAVTATWATVDPTNCTANVILNVIK